MEIIIIIVLAAALIYFLYREAKHRFTENSFFTIVNHTFRTPLTSIKWQADALNQENLSYEQTKQIARMIGTSTNKLLDIVDMIAGIKDIKSRSAYELKAVSVRELIEAAIGKYREVLNQKKINFTVTPMGSLPLLTLDTKKISFVIDTLLENAIWYSKEGGTISISSELKGGNLIISVADSGLGLSWSDRRNLFNRFYRSKQARVMNTDGTGLSLWMSTQIMRRHHGALKASSRGRNKGATFSMVLPVSR